jgi:metal-dependent amidase/aminoacylase/carboxypeptidase family protein
VFTPCYPEAWPNFAYYLQEIPGAFFILGSGSASAKNSEPLHSPRFNFDEYGLVVGTSVMANIALGVEGVK